MYDYYKYNQFNNRYFIAGGYQIIGNGYKDSVFHIELHKSHV